MRSVNKDDANPMGYLKALPVAVLGGGTVGHACVTDINMAGREVRQFEHLSEDMPEDISKAVKGAGLIVVATPAMAHESIFRALIPHLEDGQVIHIFTDNFATLLLRRLMRELGSEKKIIVGGWASTPYGIRLGKGSTKYKAITMRGASLPMSDLDAFMESARYLPCLAAMMHGGGPSVGSNVLDIGLSNLNPVVHVPVSILGVTTRENLDVYTRNQARVTYSVYNHGLCPPVCEVKYQFYEEERALASTIGIDLPYYTYESFFTSPYVLIQEHEGMDQDWINQHDVIEDIVVGCKIYHDLGIQYGVQTPVIDAMIVLAGAMHRKNFFQTSKYNLAYLGIDNLPKEELLEYLNYGMIDH